MKTNPTVVLTTDEPDEVFSVVQFFADGSYEYVARFVGAEAAVETASRLTRSVGGRVGTTRRVIITDVLDLTCFEWVHGEGVTFPPHPLERISQWT